ncbi:MOSC domain-containing protein [Micromonospora sp. PLK6-60]|uniref:MOSC domain-containing protein n=1 Tax=Micromonospora sp. PLK6-60 TaxID=2873383 RepID=UPI001CA69F87|nr:MOSC N-terminal beta barrel domain-containing protein [Micromonospora sp. PLK6-60]MBY8872034.1 MOSC domain-containing protein [Micromonospora sp. PLK6-60]
MGADLSANGGVVRQLISYPIKGCAGVPANVAEMTSAGLRHDRTFVVTDPAGAVRTQRRDPRLAVIRPGINAAGTELALHAPGEDPTRLPVDLRAAERPVVMFGSRYRGIDQGDEPAAWLSRVLGKPSRLVRVSPEHDRVTDGVTPGTSAFADSCAVHLLSVSSMEALNARLIARGAGPLPIGRFRANVIVTGWTEAHIEDHAWEMAIGNCRLSYAKLAIRCVVTTVDQDTGRRAGPEPIRTLAAYRRRSGGVAFGVKYAVVQPGRIAVGDSVVVNRWHRSAE